MSRIVIALGGNALGNNPEEQKELVKVPAAKIAELVKQDMKLLLDTETDHKLEWFSMVSLVLTQLILSLL